MKKILWTSLLLLIVCSCEQPIKGSDPFYAGFVDPPAEARPFVRWWWNGNKIEAGELIRELDVMQAAGIGGVEINPIALPDEAEDIDIESLVWLSKAWNELLVMTGQEASARDMIVDLIVGSGWPFGGEFLTKDQLLQRIVTGKKVINGPAPIQESLTSLESHYLKDHPRRYDENPQEVKLEFVYLVPTKAEHMDEVITLDIRDQTVATTVPSGTFELIYGLREIGHRDVMLGSPGAKGPVMDHYDDQVLLQYLSRLKKIEEDTGVKLSTLLRALFCDSIELAGANWSDNFASRFKSRYDYDLDPYFPFIFYDPRSGYASNDYSSEFNGELRRVRYDFNEFMVDELLQNFTSTFSDFCHDQGLLSRYQAYGVPFLMGLLEGNMIPDIPESNQWIFSAPIDTSAWLWNQGHGYMIWNMYAAAGGHLQGRKIISNEAMTNTKGVFQLTLEDMKQADDMNFITGMNHAVLHGYNYSPPEAGFPGWIRFGSYFSDQNTWWPYFKQWTTYNSRLSFVFQNAQPVKKIAILGPQSDIWSDVGLVRAPFHLTPWYLYRLWEPISQLGSSAEYLNERIIQQSAKEDGKLKFGPMTYEALFICAVESMHMETVMAVRDYVSRGGKVVFIGSKPSRTVSMLELGKDGEVSSAIDQMLDNWPDQVVFADPPSSEAALLKWTQQLWEQQQLPRDVDITDPNTDVFQIHHQLDGRDLYFFVNSHRAQRHELIVRFPKQHQTIWIWDPETGDRRVHPQSAPGQIRLRLEPLQSRLLVCTGDKGAHAAEDPGESTIVEVFPLEGDWSVTFTPVSGSSFTDTMALSDLADSEDSRIASFAGEIIYTKTFVPEQSFDFIDLGEVNRGVTEVSLNGALLGTRWYGRHRYRLEGKPEVGKAHTIQIKLVTTLANYAKSLTENPVAQRWTEHFTSKSEGLEGPVRLEVVR